MKMPIGLLVVSLVALAPAAQAPPAVEYYRLVPGFLPESFGEDGMARGSGFATANPWGAYTAYLLATNAQGQRTWRIENYLPNAAAGTAQGSSMYLFEGQARALLVDTAQNTVDAPGTADLKGVVRHLLGHTNDGAPKPAPVDFVVANTHSHGDHTGKNSLMSDRPVYYPDLDWPRTNAPSNYVPIKEGGGASTHGTGQAVGAIDLGGRTLVAIDIHEHTPGSTGYLDRENRMIATGDAIGSAYVWAHFGSITQYAESVHHLQDVLRPFDRVDVLPAHFYQIKQYARGQAPLNGRPLDKRYVDDQVRAADGILNGSAIGGPYRTVGRNASLVTVDTAQVVYTLANLYPGGMLGGAGDTSAYHAIEIPGPTGTSASAGGRFAAVDRIQSRFFLIRDSANETMFLVAGSTRALLIGTGSGTPGLAPFVKKLSGTLPLDVIVTSDDPGQIGGLSQFPGSTLHLPAGVTAPAGARVQRVSAGGRLDLGVDRAGRPLVLEVYPLRGHSPTGVTLLDVANRVLFGGDALGTQDNDAGLILREPLTAFSTAFAAWRTATNGKYDVVYTAHNYQWFTSPAYVDELQKAVDKGLAEGSAALVDSVRLSGARMIRSPGAADIVATIVVPAQAPAADHRR